MHIEQALAIRHRLVAFAIFLLACVVYLPALRDHFIWDDDLYVTENRTLTSLDGLRRIWTEPTVNVQYYPLVHTSFWVERHLWGLRPFGYHLNNVLLHAANAVLLWCVLRRLEVRGAWLAGAIFAVHPMTVESVAWITERKNVLSTFFYLFALLSYFRFSPPENENAPRHWRFYLLALALFVCALLSKTVTCSLPAAILLIVWWKRGKISLRELLPTIPFFAFGALFGAGTAWLEKHTVGAHGSDYALTFFDRCVLAARALCFYAAKLVWPAELIFIYPRWHIDAAQLWQWAFAIAAVAVVAMLWILRKKIGRGPLVAVLFFAATLFPALGFVDVFPFRYSFVADHFQYLASLGLIALLAALLTRFAAMHRIVVPIVGAMLLWLGALTWLQCGVYYNLETLWRDTLEKNNDALIAHFNLANLLAKSAQHDEALAHYAEVLRINPKFFEALANRAGVLEKTGHRDLAGADLMQALELARAAGEAEAVAVIERQIAGLNATGAPR